MNKNLIVGLCAIGMLFGVSNAYSAERDVSQPPHRHEMKEFKKNREDMAKKFAEDLGLTEEQQAKAKKMREDSRAKMKPMMEEMKKLHEKMDKAREENFKEFEKILTPEQKGKLEKIKEERKNFHKKHKNKMGKYKKEKHWDKK